ncbi:DUF4179 domain-containing protein [Fredinandcohnia sp. QZ13]|uniref:DUF4179 domain-containing protein n=1 Tax=Fredinandcohnia sp. QZ13 TaxID=3073144 RepID=UPI0028534F97|nr:DUF4179 domain-containing protein [Fredinandcohnia sp. QZ13]MDR4889688.1 DUF4179 domain-containing protein [Fredinandcohnia sp. QZ13]
MEKDLFNEMEIPTQELHSAIEKGIERGERLRRNRKYIKPLKRTSFITSGAAAVLLVSGFIFSPVNQVLAQVPIIGGIYENYQMPIGQNLAADQLITEINETAENNGVKISITSIFYDGSYVGLTFKASGENLSDTFGGETGPESGYSYKMFDGKDTSGWGGTNGTLSRRGNEYFGAMILENPNEKNPGELTLPITFTHMAGVQGEWSFNLSVDKLPSREIELNRTLFSSNKEYSVHFNDINIGKTNAILTYEELETAGIEGENLYFEIISDQGEKLSLNTVSNSKIIFDIDSKNPPKFIQVKPTYKNGNEKIDLGTLKINLN